MNCPGPKWTLETQTNRDGAEIMNAPFSLLMVHKEMLTLTTGGSHGQIIGQPNASSDRSHDFWLRSHNGLTYSRHDRKLTTTDKRPKCFVTWVVPQRLAVLDETSAAWFKVSNKLQPLGPAAYLSAILAKPCRHPHR
ncbi:hypothetical protein BaRGS_00001101 [Batillaria attramentaria]|uniref:Uncharacterized protein n=1 Tax=Batillaria attramentaria TaxID=370345 RepID=A0ABD0M727_9CAEN